MKVHKRIIDKAWVLPRPRRKDKYIGSFPMLFEQKLYEEIGIDPQVDLVLHPFGGRAEYGYRVDLSSEVEPDIIGDAHHLPFKNDVFDCIVLDPPYNEAYAKRLYGVKNPKFWTYVNESVRVLKDGGFLIIYHFISTPAIPQTVLIGRIFMETRMWHKLRCVHIHKKFVQSWERSHNKGLGLL